MLQHKTNKYLSDSKFGGRLGPDANQMVAVQAVFHIDAVAVEMEVKDAGLAVRMERDDVLGIGKAAWRPVASFLSGQPDPVESQDEVLFNPVNCF